MIPESRAEQIRNARNDIEARVVLPVRNVCLVYNEAMDAGYRSVVSENESSIDEIWKERLKNRPDTHLGFFPRYISHELLPRHPRILKINVGRANFKEYLGLQSREDIPTELKPNPTSVNIAAEYHRAIAMGLLKRKDHQGKKQVHMLGSGFGMWDDYFGPEQLLNTGIRELVEESVIPGFDLEKLELVSYRTGR